MDEQVESTSVADAVDPYVVTGRKLLTLLDEDGPGGVQIAATSLRIADLASVLDHAENDRDRFRLFVALPPELAGEVLEECRPETRDLLLEESDDQHLVRILAESDADDAVYFLDHLDEDRAEHLLSKLDADLRHQLEEQYEREDDVAGRIMVHEVITLRSFMTAQQALDHIRSFGNRATASYNHTFSTLYVVDAEARLVGVLPFRKLVFASPRETVAQLMDKDVITVDLDTDREQVARLMQKYHLLTVAVVDAQKRIRGMVTWDDAVDVLEAEAEEDLLTIAGTSEDLEDNASLVERAKSRLPWLIITAIGGFINAKVIADYGGGLSNQMLLVGFMPLVGALGGNIGLQCSTVTVRGLATGAIKKGSMLASVGKEIGTGVLLAFTMAIICGLGGAGVALTTGDSPVLGVIMACSLLLAVLLAAALGVVVPLLCERFKIDPAIAAGPFITMLNDVSGYAIYISTVYVLLRTFA